MTASSTATAQTAPEHGHSDEEYLQHHFHDLRQQHEASMLGMWSFLATEVLFFGGLIASFIIYRSMYPDAFAAATRRQNVMLGGINTVVLLTSSLTMALAVRAAQLSRPREVVGYLIATMVLGAGFLGIKAIEYHHDYEVGLIPFVNFRWEPEHGAAGGAEAGHTAGTADARETGQAAEQGIARIRDRIDPELPPSVAIPIAEPFSSSMPQSTTGDRARLYFVFYFFMTGLHAIHMIIGLVLVGIIAALVGTGWFSGTGETQVEVTGLYWHFIDIVWVFLYPLLYLLEIHQ